MKNIEYVIYKIQAYKAIFGILLVHCEKMKYFLTDPTEGYYIHFQYFFTTLMSNTFVNSK